MIDPRTKTRWFVLSTLAALAVWTAVMWLVHGGRATVSSVFGWLFSMRYLGWWAIAIFGLVVGHLPGMLKHETDLYWWRVALFQVMLMVGFLLTWRMP